MKLKGMPSQIMNAGWTGLDRAVRSELRAGRFFEKLHMTTSLILPLMPPLDCSIFVGKIEDLDSYRK
jgi:hypothetical protein